MALWVFHVTVIYGHRTEYKLCYIGGLEGKTQRHDLPPPLASSTSSTFDLEPPSLSSSSFRPCPSGPPSRERPPRPTDTHTYTHMNMNIPEYAATGYAVWPFRWSRVHQALLSRRAPSRGGEEARSRDPSTRTTCSSAIAASGMDRLP